MPIEITIFAPEALGVDEQREFAETFNPPLVAIEGRGGGTVEFTELDHTRVLTLGRPRRVETLTDLRRVFGDEPDLPVQTRTMVEGVVPFAQYERGLALVFAFEQATGGKAILKGVTL